MADIDQLKAALIKAHNAGDTEAANLFANKIKQLQGGQQSQVDLSNTVQTSAEDERQKLIQEMNAELNPVEAGLVAAGRGMTKIGRALGIADAEDASTKAAFADLKEQSPVATFVGEVAGETAPFLLPGLGQAGLAARLGGGAAARATTAAGLGALEAGLIARGEGGTTDEQALSASAGGLVAGTMELALPVVGRHLGKVYRRLTGKAPAGSLIDPATGQPTAELLTVLKKEGLDLEDINAEALKDLAELNPSQVVRKQFFESQGLKPTRAQITRNASDFQLQEEAAKTSGRVRSMLEDQDAVLTTRFNNEIVKTGGNASSDTASVFDAITEKATVLDQRISDLYDIARQKSGAEQNIRFDRLTKKLQELAPDNEVTGGAIKSIVGTLKQQGSVKKFKPTGRVDVETAEKVRKKMNALYDPKNPQRNFALRELKDALDDDVFKAQGRDIFEDARKAKRDFETELSRAKVSKFDSRKKNIVRDILENKIDPDRMVESVVTSRTWRPDDLQQLKDYISTTGAGKQAFDDLRAETMNYIKSNAFAGAKDEAGMQRITRSRLESVLDKIGDKKRRVLFSKDENKFLDDVLKLTELREPVAGTAMGRGPSAQAIAKVEQKLKDFPLLGGLIDFIDIDVGGRIALKSNPEKKIVSTLPSPFRGAIGGSIGASVASQEDSE